MASINNDAILSESVRRQMPANYKLLEKTQEGVSIYGAKGTVYEQRTEGLFSKQTRVQGNNISVVGTPDNDDIEVQGNNISVFGSPITNPKGQNDKIKVKGQNTKVVTSQGTMISFAGKNYTSVKTTENNGNNLGGRIDIDSNNLNSDNPYTGIIDMKTAKGGNNVKFHGL